MTPNHRKITELSRRQVRRLCELYASEWWTQGRSRDDVERMLLFSDYVFGVVDETDELAAFARVLTDRVFKALIFDLIVDPAHRG